jgi:sorting nexin-29
MFQLFNDIWNAGRTPEEWETALIVNIFKTGDKSKCENYRGIPLLPTAYELHGKILKDKSQPTAENILREEQRSFRKGRSTTDVIFTIKQITEKNMNLIYPYIYVVS